MYAYVCVCLIVITHILLSHCIPSRHPISSCSRACAMVEVKHRCVPLHPLTYCMNMMRLNRYAILDECTSAVSKEMENLLYTECQRLGITYITICHRPALRMWHKLSLNLLGDGTVIIHIIFKYQL